MAKGRLYLWHREFGTRGVGIHRMVLQPVPGWTLTETENKMMVGLNRTDRIQWRKNDDEYARTRNRRDGWLGSVLADYA